LATPRLQAFRTTQRYAALTTSAVGSRIPWITSAFAPLVDEPGRPHRIAITGGPNKIAGNQHLYYFLGSKLQNEIVYVSVARDASVPVYDREHPVVPLANPSTWAERVRASGASHVVVLAPAWHELGWMRHRPGEFEIVAGNGMSWLFRVRR
jgi:hypothetical protein